LQPVESASGISGFRCGTKYQPAGQISFAPIANTTRKHNLIFIARTAYRPRRRFRTSVCRCPAAHVRPVRQVDAGYGGDLAKPVRSWRRRRQAPKPSRFAITVAGAGYSQRRHCSMLQPAARICCAGNGPSAFSVRIESQYSLTSLILPCSNRNTRQ